MWSDLWSCCEGGQLNQSIENLLGRMRQDVHTIKEYFAGVCSTAVRFHHRNVLSRLNKFFRRQRFLSQRFYSSPHLKIGAVALGLFAGAQLTMAQNAEAQETASTSESVNDAITDARIQILTRPIGAFVFLDGEYSTAGRTPYTITHHLKGVYRIRAKNRGFEDWSTDYLFNGQGDDKLTIKMTPKTRTKAAWRSLLFSGLGQCYSDRKTTGVLLGLMQASGAGVLIYQQSQYNKAQNAYNVALQNYRANQQSQDGQQALINALRGRQADLNEAYDRRQRWLLINGAVYVYNLIDVLFFFPSYQKGGVEAGVTLQQSPDAQRAVVGLNMKAKF